MKKLGKESAFTLIELLVVAAIIVFLAATMLKPSKGGPTNVARCMSNQKQITIFDIMWAGDHEGAFPAEVSTTTNGTMEFIATGYASLQFRPLSAYPVRTDAFVCPLDKTKHVAETVKNLRDENVSYFINTDTTTINPSHSVLTGDRDLQANGQPVKPGLFELTTNLDMNWTGEIHKHGGILSFADGHVEYVQSNGLNSVFLEQPNTTNRFCVP